MKGRSVSRHQSENIIIITFLQGTQSGTQLISGFFVINLVGYSNLSIFH